MKQNIRLFILLAVLLLWSVGCAVVNAGSGTTSSELASSVIASSEAVSSKEVSASSVLQTQSAVTSSKTESRELYDFEMSYDEYFSEKRLIMVQDYSLRYHVKADGIYVDETSADKTIQTKCVYKAEIIACTSVRQHVFFVTKADPKSVYYYNCDTGFSMKVVTIEEDIEKLSGSWITFFVKTKSAVYRVHVPSKTVDYVMANSEDICGFIPLSNQEIQYYVYSDGWLEYVKKTGDKLNVGQYSPMYDYYYYNISNQETMLYKTQEEAHKATSLMWQQPRGIMKNPYG